jgi:hypothetical protein
VVRPSEFEDEDDDENEEETSTCASLHGEEHRRSSGSRKIWRDVRNERATLGACPHHRPPLVVGSSNQPVWRLQSPPFSLASMRLKLR